MRTLRPFEKIYHLANAVKNFFYDKNFIRPEKINIPVISVGNLSFGGVGKTPCVIYLAKQLSPKYKINIITKSYKASLRQPKSVDLNLNNAAKVFGDEACLIQASLKECQVWSGPVKYKTALASLINKPDLIILDDGFSHRKLTRNFDLVLIDALKGTDDYFRESIINLQRAHAIIITKSNLAGVDKILNIKKQILSKTNLLEKNIYEASSNTELSFDTTSPIFIFCGLGNPDGLFVSLEKQGYEILSKIEFPDHHQYTEAEQNQILSKFLELKQQQPALKLVTTYKDKVKVTNSELLKNLNTADYVFEIAQNKEEDLLEAIRKTL